MTPERRAEREGEYTGIAGIAFVLFIALYLLAHLLPANR